MQRLETGDEAAPGEPVQLAPAADGEYRISRVLATRYDTKGKQKRYWVRWAGYGPQADSWIPARLAGQTEKQLDAWIRLTHRHFPPLALPGALIVPAGKQNADVGVTAQDRAALHAAEAAA